MEFYGGLGMHAYYVEFVVVLLYQGANMFFKQFFSKVYQYEFKGSSSRL